MRADSISEPSPPPARLRCAAWAAAAAALALAMQWSIVQARYNGDWSALFYTGTAVEAPPELAGEAIRRVPGEVGFDGQYYHFIAHDPWLRGEMKLYVDNARMRWRRILTPASAFLLALGDGQRIDAAYRFVVLVSAALGAYWLARFCVGAGLHPALGLLFLLVPATTISLERMTVDAGLAALSVAFALYLREGSRVPLLLVLAAAPFARETGVFFAGACLLGALLDGRRRQAACYAATLVPWFAWALYVGSRTFPDATAWFSAVPWAGLVSRTLDPFPDPMTTLYLARAAKLEYLAVAGVWAAVALCAYALWKRPRGRVEIAAAMILALFAFLAKPDIWQHVYGFGRTLSPAFILLALIGIERRQVLFFAPLAASAPRVVYEIYILLK